MTVPLFPCPVLPRSVLVTRDNITRIDSKRAVYVSADVDKEVLSATELVARLQDDVAPRMGSAVSQARYSLAGEAEERGRDRHLNGENVCVGAAGNLYADSDSATFYVQPLVI